MKISGRLKRSRPKHLKQRWQHTWRSLGYSWCRTVGPSSFARTYRQVFCMACRCTEAFRGRPDPLVSKSLLYIRLLRPNRLGGSACRVSHRYGFREITGLSDAAATTLADGIDCVISGPHEGAGCRPVGSLAMLGKQGVTWLRPAAYDGDTDALSTWAPSVMSW